MIFFKQSNKKEILKFGIGGAIAEALYVLLVAVVFSNLEKLIPTPPVMLGFFLMLLLFVLSAAISGVLVFGYPLYLVSQKKYHESALVVLTSLLTILLIFVMIILMILINN